MWKESLRIGVDIIDAQHKALFMKTEELLAALHDSHTDHKQECINAIVFLKNYALNHFKEEETYQLSIGYKDFEAHKQLHIGFVKTLLEHEKKMTASDFAPGDIKAFTGMLITWLLYHISNSDQKFVKDTKEEVADYDDIVFHSVRDVLHKMAGLSPDTMKEVASHDETFAEALAIKVGVVGDAPGFYGYTYSVAFIKNLINTMMGFVPAAIGELELSAMNEVSNIISGTICRQIAQSRNLFCDITPPLAVNPGDIQAEKTIAVDTGLGIIKAGIAISA